MMIKNVIGLCCFLFSIESYGSLLLGSKLFDNASFFSPSIDPAGEWVSAQMRDSGVTSLVIVKKDEDDVFPLIQTETGIWIDQYHWLDRNHIYVSFVGKVEKQGIIAMDFSADKPIVTYTDIHSSGYLLQALPQRENRLRYVLRDRKGKLQIYDMSVVDLIDGHFKKSDRFEKPLKSAAFYYPTNEDELFGVTFGGKQTDATVWFFDIHQQSWRKVFTFSEDEEKFEPIGFLDESTLVVLSDYGQDRVSLMEFNVDDQRFGDILYQHHKYDLYSAIYDSENKLVQGVSYYSHGRLSTQFLTTKEIRMSNKLRRTFSGKQIYPIAESVDGNVKILSVFSSDLPMDYFVLDQQKNTARPLSSSRPELADYSFQKTHTIVVKNDVNQDIEAFLTLPDDVSNNGTLLVMPHGGPIGIGENDFFNPEAQYFASRGYAVLRVNFRGSSGYGKAFEQSGVGQFGKAIEQDITAVVNHVRRDYHFSHMCSIGASYGGYSAMMLAIYQPDDYDCIVSMYGVYDLPFLFNSRNWRTEEEFEQVMEKVVGKRDDSLREVSPLYLADRISAPVLLIAGKEDDIADFEHSNRMAYILEMLDHDVETVFYKKVGHGHRNWTGDRHQYAYIDDYIRRKLRIPYTEQHENSEARLEEHVLLADHFLNDKSIEERPEYAFRHYRAAAERGHGRSMFNVGSYYHRGDSVDEDIDQALYWYEKSAQADYAIANFRLGKLYRNNPLVERDYQRSFQYFQKAYELDPSAAAFLSIGRAYCLGNGVEKDVLACLDYLDFSKLDIDKNELTKSDRKLREKMITEIIAKGSFSEHELRLITRFIENKYSLTAFPISFSLENYGTYRKNSDGDLIHESTLDVVSVADNAVPIGAQFTLKDREKKYRREKTSIYALWTKYHGDYEQVVSAHLLWGNTGETWSSWYWLHEDEKDAVFKLEVFDNEQNLLLTRIFRT